VQSPLYEQSCVVFVLQAYGREVVCLWGEEGRGEGAGGRRGRGVWEVGKRSREGKGEEEKGGKIKDCSSSVLYLTNTT